MEKTYFFRTSMFNPVDMTRYEAWLAKAQATYRGLRVMHGYAATNLYAEGLPAPEQVSLSERRLRQGTLLSELCAHLDAQQVIVLQVGCGRAQVGGGEACSVALLNHQGQVFRQEDAGRIREVPGQDEKQVLYLDQRGEVQCLSLRRLLNAASSPELFVRTLNALVDADPVILRQFDEERLAL